MKISENKQFNPENLHQNAEETLNLGYKEEERKQLIRQNYIDIINIVSEAIYVLDESFSFIEVNKGAEKMYQFTREELIGQTPDSVAAPGMNDMPTILQMMQSVLQTGKEVKFDFWGKRKNGEIFPKSVIVNKGKFFDQDVLIATARDITERKKIETKSLLKDTEFVDLFENAPIGYHEIDLEGRITRINQTELNMLGYTYDELNGQFIWEFVADKAYSFEVTKEKLKNHQLNSTPYEREFVRKDGKRLPILVVDKLIIADNGEVTGIRSSIQDISEQKRTEEVLKLRETYLTAIIENLPGMIWLKDVDSHLLMTNTNFAHTFGSEKPEDLLGKTDLEFSLKEHAEKYLADDKKVVVTKKPLYVEELIYDQKSIKWFETFKMPIFDENKNVIGTTGYAQDITERKETQLEVQRISQHYQAIIEKSPDGFVLIDEHNKFKYASPSAYKMFGYELSDLVGLGPDNLIHPDDLAMVFSNLNRVFNDPDYTTTMECRLRHKNGNWMWIESIFTDLIQDPAVQSIVINFRDVNDRRHAEDKLRESEDKYRNIFENIQDVFYQVDMNGIITDISPSVKDYFGLDSEFVIGKLVFDFYANTEDRDKFLNTIKQNGLVRDYEVDLKSETTGIIHSSINARIIFDANSQPVAIEGFIRDITERKKSEIAIKESEERYRMLAENSTDVIFKMTMDGKYSYISPSVFQLRGFTVEESMTQTLEEMICPGSLPFVLESFGKSLTEYYEHNMTESGLVELEQPCKDGTTVWTEASARLVFNEKGEPDGYIGVSRNISDRKKAEREIQRISNHYQAIIEKSPDGFVLLNEQGKFKYTSPSALRMFGYSNEELNNTDPVSLTHPDDLEMVLGHLNRLFEDPAYIPVIEYRFKHKNGDYTWIESTFSNLLSDQNVESILINYRNINERKISESLLKQQRELYLDLVNTQPAGIYRIRVSSVEKWTEKAWSNSANSPYIVELASDRFCEIIGVSRTEFENNPKIIGDLIHPDDQLEYEIRNKEANFNQTPFNWDCRMLIKGIVKWVHFESVPRKLDNGDLIFTGILYDINDRKIAEEKLLRNKELLNDLLHSNSEFIESSTENIDFEQLCEQIKEISGAKFVSFNLYEPNGLDFRTVALVGVKDIYSRAIQITGFELTNKLWKFDPIRDEKIKNKTITRFENMIELNGKVIPKSVSKLIQSTLNLGEIQIVNISKKSKRVGDFTLYFEKNTSLKNEEIVELFANQVALYVDRKLAERKRDESKLRLKRAEIASKSGNWEFYLESNTMIGSEGAKILYGLDNVEFNYNIVKDIPVAEYRPMLDLALKNLIEKDEPYNIEFRIKTADTAEIKDIHSTAVYNKSTNVVFGIIQDITEQKVAERKLQTNRDVLSKLLFTSTEFIDSDAEIIDYKKISDNIFEISGAKYCSFNILSQNQSSFRTVAISGIDTIQKSLKSLVGFDLMGKEWESDPNKERKINHKIITKFDSLADLTGTVLPKKMVNLVTKMFDVGEVWIVQVKKKDIVIGDFTLIFSRNETLQNREIVELYANQIALFIERKHIENELLESEKKYKILFAENPQPMLVYNLDTLEILEINQTAIDFYGYNRDEFLSMSLTALHPKEEIPEFLISIKETRKGKYTDGISLHQKKNGEKVYVSISSATAPIFGENARHILIVDMTDRLIAEKKLAESELFFRQSQQAANIGSYHLNMTTGLWSSSEVMNELFGIDNQYVKSVQGWVELVAEEDREMMNDYFANYVLDQKQPFNKEYRISRKSDGKVSWVLGLGELTIENNVVTAMTGTIQDISERKNAEIELLEKMNQLQRFHNLTVDRELSMITLKKEINELLLKLGQEPKYRIVE